MNTIHFPRRKPAIGEKKYSLACKSTTHLHNVYAMKFHDFQIKYAAVYAALAAIYELHCQALPRLVNLQYTKAAQSARLSWLRLKLDFRVENCDPISKWYIRNYAHTTYEHVSFINIVVKRYVDLMLTNANNNK